MPEMVTAAEVMKSSPISTTAGGRTRSVPLRSQGPDLSPYLEQAAKLVPNPKPSDVSALYDLDRETRICRSCPGLENCPRNGLIPQVNVALQRIYLNYGPCEKARGIYAERRMRSMLRAAGLPENLEDRSINGFTRTDGTEAARLAAIEAGMRIRAKDLSGKGLLLMGPPGVGKSHLEVALARVALEAGFNAVFVSLPDLIDASKKWFDHKKGPDPADVVAEADVTILDDMGAESTRYPWVAERVFRILDRRMRARKLTFATTNLVGPDQIAKHYNGDEGIMGGRIISRLAELCQWIPVTGPDWRLMKK